MRSTRNFLVFVCLLFSNTLYGQYFSWAVGLGGVQNEEANDLKVDASGNVYTLGKFGSPTDFDPGPGSTVVTPTGTHDMFLSKLDGNGNFVSVWCVGGLSGTYFRPGDIERDASGNMYISGFFYGLTADFDPGPGIQNQTPSGNDGFVLKLNAAGNFVWVKKISNCEVQDLSLDASGNVFFTGKYSGTIDADPGVLNVFQTSNGNTDIILIKLNSAGTYQWSKNLGGTFLETPATLDLRANGNILITGFFGTTIDCDPGPGTYNLTAGPMAPNSFIVEWDAAGDFINAVQLMGPNIYDLHIDGGDNLYLCGTYPYLTDFDPGPGVHNDTTFMSSRDAFILKLNSSMDFLWERRTGNFDFDYAFSISGDAAGNIYCSGSFGINCDIDPGPGTNFVLSNGDNDIFVQKLDANGNHVWSVATGGADWDGALLYATSNGTLYLYNTFYNNIDLDPGPGVANLLSNGNQDVFITKWNPGAIVSGTIRHPNNTSVIRSTTVAWSGASSGSMVTGTSGTYSISNLVPGGNYTVSPSKANDTTTNNGITTLDLVLMQRHILNIDTLNSPYKIIAADVNNSSSVTTLDLVLARTVILQTSLTFPSGRLWYMVDAAHSFSNPLVPWPYPSTKNFPSASSMSNQDFYGIKLGDVNWSWNPAVSKTEYEGTLGLQFGTAEMTAEGEMRIPVLIGRTGGPPQLEIAGFQFTLEWNADNLTFVSAEGYGLSPFIGKADKGLLTVSWNPEDGGYRTLQDGSALFYLKFKTNAPAGSNCGLKINSSLINAEAYSKDLKILELVDESGEIFIPGLGESGVSCFPNPVSNWATVRFFANTESVAEVSILSLTGEVISSAKVNAGKGVNEVRVDFSGFGRGSYLVRVEGVEGVGSCGVLVVE